jgi:flagellar hook assembly protein FlgD
LGVKGSWSNQEEHQVNHSIGLFYIAGGLSIRTLIDEQKSAGYYVVEWDTRDDNGLLVPEGYYRIYLRVNDFMKWLDIAIMRN